MLSQSFDVVGNKGSLANLGVFPSLLHENGVLDL